MDNSEILCCTGKLIEFLPDTEADFALWIFWPCQSRQVQCSCPVRQKLVDDVSQTVLKRNTMV